MQPIEPFLLPVCSECGGPTRLSKLEPDLWNGVDEFRTYECAWCGKSHTRLVARRAPNASTQRGQRS